MAWKFVLIWLFVGMVAAIVLNVVGQLVRNGSIRLSDWRQYLPWRLTDEIEHNRDVSVFFPIMALGAEVILFLILAIVILCLYLA